MATRLYFFTSTGYLPTIAIDSTWNGHATGAMVCALRNDKYAPFITGNFTPSSGVQRACIMIAVTPPFKSPMYIGGSGTTFKWFSRNQTSTQASIEGLTYPKIVARIIPTGNIPSATWINSLNTTDFYNHYLRGDKICEGQENLLYIDTGERLQFEQGFWANGTGVHGLDTLRTVIGRPSGGWDILPTGYNQDEGGIGWIEFSENLPI